MFLLHRARWLLLTAVLGCSQPASHGHEGTPSLVSVDAAVKPKAAPKSSSTPAGKPTPGTTPSASVYQLHVALVDQDGKARGLDAFAGQPVILSMFYSSCTAMCPLLITHLHELEAALSPAARAKTHFLLVSFDPERDTPQKLRKLAADHGIDTKRWSLARTSPGSVQELAAVLDIRYRRLLTGEIAHASVVSVLDRSGVVVKRADDTGGQAAELARIVERTLAGR